MKSEWRVGTTHLCGEKTHFIYRMYDRQKEDEADNRQLLAPMVTACLEYLMGRKLQTQSRGEMIAVALLINEIGRM